MIRRSSRFLVFIIAIIFCQSCAIKKNSNKIVDYSTEGYRMVWSDEFDKDGTPDPKNWTYENGFVRNNELQWYQPQNAFVKNGVLVIEARKEQKPNPNFDEGSKSWRKNRKNWHHENYFD